jgi:hypothetical protein
MNRELDYTTPSDSMLASIPTSVRQHLERAQTLAAQGNYSAARSADVARRQATAEVAKTSPEIYALLMAIELGYHEITATQTEITTGFEKIQKRFCGIDLGEQLVPVTTTRTVTRTLRLS